MYFNDLQALLRVAVFAGFDKYIFAPIHIGDDGKHLL
jgi:hypothetical protein